MLGVSSFYSLSLIKCVFFKKIILNGNQVGSRKKKNWDIDTHTHTDNPHNKPVYICKSSELLKK